MKIQDKLYFPISEPIQSFDEYMDQSVWDIFWEQSKANLCLLYTSPSPRDATLSRMPSSA